MADRHRKATQFDVARGAGVSQATVSLVLGAFPATTIRANTSARVREVARELGYAPNHFAQALRTKKARTIAVVVPDISNPFFPTLLKGVQSIMEHSGYDVIAINTEGDNEREQRFLRWSLQGRVDGVVGVFFTLHSEDFKPLAENGVAVVRIESSLRKASELPIDNISVDNRGAAAVATRFLLARGHERVAMIAGPGGPQGERAAGYLAALAERGLAPDIVSGGEFNEQGGRNGALALLARERRPTAIFAANDLMAIGAMSTLRDHGIVVPRDLAIVGFDDIFVAQLVTPSLTTVSQFQSDLGMAAAQALLARLSGATGPGGTSREMPFKLIERQST